MMLLFLALLEAVLLLLLETVLLLLFETLCRSWMGGRAELLAMYLSMQYRAGRWRSRQGRRVGIELVSLSLLVSKASVRAAARDELAEQASSQLTTQMLRESTWSTQSLGLSSSSSPGAGSCLERPSGP